MPPEKVKLLREQERNIRPQKSRGEAEKEILKNLRPLTPKELEVQRKDIEYWKREQKIEARGKIDNAGLSSETKDQQK